MTSIQRTRWRAEKFPERATIRSTAVERRRFALRLVLVVLSVFALGWAFILPGSVVPLQLGAGALALFGLALLRFGRERPASVAAILACLVVPYVGLATPAAETSAIQEVVWLVTAILVAGLVLPPRWLIPALALHLSAAASLALVNPQIPVARTGEMIMLLVLVAAITALTSTGAERVDRVFGAAMEDMRTRERELQLFERIGSLLVEGQGDEAIGAICQTIRDHFGLELVSIYLVEPDGEWLRLLAHSSYDLPADHEGFRLSDRCLIAECARTGVPQHIEDHPERFAGYLAGSPKVESEYVLPLKAEGRVVGVLNCEHGSPGGFPPEVQLLLGRAAHLCAIALERAASMTRLEQRVTRRTAKLKQEIAERRQVEEDLLRANRELELAQQEVLQAGKLAALGEMGAGMAHELNQPLAAIQALAEAIQARPDDPVEAHVHDLGLIGDQVQRMTRIVDNVRLFARQGPIRTERVPALAPLDDALTLLVNRFRLVGVEVLPTIECGPVSIDGDHVQLQHVFMNLLTNALQALEGLSEDRPRKLRLSVRTERHSVVYEIEDNGPGVPPDLEAKIFDPFFTTKAPGAGTGLGLSLSLGVVQKHRGELVYERADSGGARFKVTLPLLVQPEVFEDAGEPEPVAEEAADSAVGRVVVVDDEQVVRLAFSRLLESWGWQVSTARSAAEAVELLDRQPVDLAIVDLKMPRASGSELCAEIQRRWPAVRVLPCSGHVEDRERARLNELGIEKILHKPVRGQELRRTIDRLMA